MRLVVLLTVFFMFTTFEPLSAYAGVDLDSAGNPKPMSESEYNRQKREMEKQKKELLDSRANESGQGTTGASPPQASTQEPVNGPNGKKIPSGNDRKAKPGWTKPEEDQGTVIKRKEEPKPEHGYNEKEQIQFTQQPQKRCASSGFGVCAPYNK